MRLQSLPRARSLAAAVLVLLSTSACGDGPTPPKTEDGELLLFTRWVGAFLAERPVIEVVRPDGRGRRQLTAAGRAERDGAWSPDGRRIAFVRLDSSDTQTEDAWPHLYVMDADGSHVRQLTTGCGSAATPSWSPDGARLVYSGTDCGGLAPPVRGRLYVVNGDGSDPHPITPESMTSGDIGPDWSPDGTRILFRASGAGTSIEMFTIRPDGSGRAPLAAAGTVLCDGSVRAAHWSPDGTRVAYECLGAPFLMVASSDGTSPVRLTGPLDPDVPIGGDYDAVWSPDGQHIAITRDDSVRGRALLVTAAAPAGAAAGARGPLVTDLAFFRVTSWRAAPR